MTRIDIKVTNPDTAAAFGIAVGEVASPLETHGRRLIDLGRAELVVQGTTTGKNDKPAQSRKDKTNKAANAILTK